jgi:hypothetical protein
MKKLPLKKFRRSNADAMSAATRITNDTVAEHREQILAGGRKFKYPIQYARHKLVINALLVTFASVVLLVALAGWQLYIVQNSSTFLYRLTRIIPVPVAVINGEQVRFSNYLVQYKGSEYYLSKYGEIKFNTADGKRQLDYIKRESMNKAVADAYARQIADERSITITSKDVDKVIDQQRNADNGRISQEAYDASSLMLLGLTPSDIRLMLQPTILRTRVAFAVDKDAKEQVTRATALLKDSNNDFTKVAEQLASSKGGKVIAGQSGLVSNVSTFGGLQVSDVAKLAKDQVSGVLQSSTDSGYYFVKVLDKNDTQVSFSYLHIPLTTFNNNLAELKKNGKVTEFIHLANK